MEEKTSDTRLAAAKSGEEAAFRGLVEPHAAELLAFAYRMLGGFHDAEDALQEARLKAWRNLESLETSANLRAWLYRIVANVCLDAKRADRRRLLPQDAGPAVAPGPPLTEPRSDILWLEPYPDALLPTSPDPEAALRSTQSIRLAFVRAMQVLPARQRAALILHDVLDLSAAEVAVALDSSVPSVNSALQRARQSLAQLGVDHDAVALETHQAEAVSRFVEAWETGNFSNFLALLRDDVVMSMPPWLYWIDGRAQVTAGLTNRGAWQGEPRAGQFRLVTTRINGEPAALAYFRMPDGRYGAVCLTVLSLDVTGQVTELTVFTTADLFTRWGFPAELS